MHARTLLHHILIHPHHDRAHATPYAWYMILCTQHHASIVGSSFSSVHLRHPIPVNYHTDLPLHAAWPGVRLVLQGLAGMHVCGHVNGLVWLSYVCCMYDDAYRARLRLTAPLSAPRPICAFSGPTSRLCLTVFTRAIPPSKAGLASRSAR